MLFDSENPETLTAAVEHLLAEPETAQRMGRADRLKAENMSWDSVNDIAIQNFIDLICRNDNRRKRRRLRFLRPDSTLKNEVPPL